MASSHSSLRGFSASFRVILGLFIVSILLLVRADAQSTQSDEIQALLSFKKENAYYWERMGYPVGFWNNWKESDTNACAWAGVTCTTNNTVWELDLSGWIDDLGAAYDWDVRLDTLSNLTDFRQLDLTSNTVVSIDFGGVTGLTRLDLSSNHLMTFPEGICNLTGLTRLDLSFNRIQGPIPPCISAFPSLRFMSLQQNQFSGEIPRLRSLRNLQFLHLADNQLSGPFPSDLGVFLNNITFVDFSNNFLNGSIPPLPSLNNLIQLRLDNNSFTKFEDGWIIGTIVPGQNSSIQRLSVSSNQLEGVIPSGISDLQNLKYLNMSSNRLSGSIPSGLSELYKVFYVDLSQNRLVGNIPTGMFEQSIGHIECLHLNLSHNILNGSIPNTDTANMACFFDLDISHNNLRGGIPSTLTSDVLWLQNNRLSGDIVDYFLQGAGFKQTYELRLQNNLLTGDLSRIANTSSICFLIILDLRNNDLRWSTSAAIPNPIMATLEKLICDDGVIELWFGGNNFLGTSIPNEFFLMSRLTVLDLSNSHLKGGILGATFNSSCLPSLQLLNLSNNHISGSVPKDILMLPSLGVLSLSHNNLSGSLPSISSNSSLFNPENFVGNVGLCGLPLDPCPELHHPGRAGVQWWILLLIIGGSIIIAMGSCLVASWRWRVYHKKHEQDADLIKTLMERDSAALMSLREVKKATDNFAESAQIGEGGFGAVYIGKLNDGTTVAIKRSKREGSDQNKEQFLNEVRILSQVNHRNLVKLLGCCLENKIAVLVFEFVSNGTIQEHLQGKMGADRLSWKQRLNIAVQTANGLNYLHTSATFPIYHRDVKTANILLTDDLDAKVADFGISKLAPLEATHVSTVAVQGTMGYIDPEYYTSYQLTDKSDVFSYGVVLLELISAKPALDFSRGGENTSLVNLASSHIKSGDLHGLIDPALMETYSDPAGQGRESLLDVGRLAMRCVEMQSKARPTMNEVLTELQNLWVKLDGTGKDVVHCMTEHDDDCYNDNDEEVAQSDDRAALSDRKRLLSKTFSGERFSEDSHIELSQFRIFSSGSKSMGR